MSFGKLPNMKKKTRKKGTQRKASFLPCLRAFGFITYHSVQDVEHSERCGVITADGVVMVWDAGPNDERCAAKNRVQCRL